MKGWQVVRVVLVIMASFCLLVSCSGSSSDTVAGGGIGGTGYTSSGTITAFGSILVNGVRFDTTKARVIIGGRQKGIGDQAILENLDIGQVVLVEGTANGQSSYGVATRVRFTPHLKGPVASVEDIDQNVKRFKVLGQTIITDDSTIIKNTSMGDLSLDNLIEVSGLMDVAGVIRATYIKKLADFFDPAIEVEIKGSVQNLDLNSKT
ncbi:MAG: DUF5666 domain-containing protein, partial [Deltaproteobacteria bacterium]|nr:DUF5666 domain-containing protein [Deltaproteobacteria bacterium]